MHKLDGVEIAIDNSKCIDCMKCLNEICMSEAISFKDNAIQINQNKCRGCDSVLIFVNKMLLL